MSPMRTLWRLFGFGRPHRAVLGLAFLAMVLLALMNGALAFLTGPALRFLLSGGHQGMGRLEQLWPPVRNLSHATALWVLPGLIVAIALLKGVAYLGQFYFSGLFGHRVVGDLRRAFFDRASRLSPLQLSQQRSGDLLSRFGADLQAVETAAIYTVASYVRDGLQVLVLVGLGFYLSWKMTAVVLVLGPLAAWPVSRLTRTVLGRTREAQGRLGELAAQLREGLGGLRTLQAFGAYDAERARFESQGNAHRRAVVHAAWARGAVPGLMELLAAFAIASALTFAAAHHALSADELVSFLTALVLVYQPAKDLGRTTQFAQQAAVAGERLFAVLDLADLVVEDSGRPSPPLEHSVRFEDVHFAYGDRGALAGLSFEAVRGKTTALVGPSGAGKSTVTALALRFAHPASGRILIDGQDVASLRAASVRLQFALVTQDAQLFAGSVRDNLRYGRPTASDAEVEAAAGIAQAHEFVQALPQGYDTVLSERGVGLSGGQRQRLCLARALVSGAPVLVLDEATSNLDPEAEREVQAALENVFKARTALVIAHRLASVVHADVIYVMDQGRAVESGTHAELLSRRGLYARLWALQSAEAGANAA